MYAFIIFHPCSRSAPCRNSEMYCKWITVHSQMTKTKKLDYVISDHFILFSLTVLITFEAFCLSESYFGVTIFSGTTSFRRNSPCETSSQQGPFITFYCLFFAAHAIPSPTISSCYNCSDNCNWIVTALWKRETWRPVWLTCVAAFHPLPQ